MTKKLIILLFLIFGINSNIEANYKIEYKKNQINIFVGKLNSINIIENVKTKLIALDIKNNEIYDYFLDSLENRYEQLDYNKLNKVILGYSNEGRKIYGYYKGDISKPFFGVFANIHGGYEYGSYLTAKLMIDEFDKSGKKQWFIIPTLNPDGLNYAKKDNFSKSFYLNGRNNSNNIDLNRSFCSDDFINSSYKKRQKEFFSSNECNSEIEIKVIDNILNTYEFYEIISLHSEGKIFFIPDNSYYDKKIINLTYKLKTILPNYYYVFPTYDSMKDFRQIQILEINEGLKGDDRIYTGLMENYIYEKYNIPTVLIELDKHGEIEYNLSKYTKYLQN